MQSGEIHWFGAPNGIAIGPSGSAVIESPAHALTEKNSHELPNEMVTLLSARGAPHHVILHDATQTPSPETLALWAAATGATFTVDSENTVTSGNSIALSAVSPTTITQPRHAIDRALLVACVASLACVGVAAIQWFSDHALLKNATDSSATSTVGTISGVSANTARGTLAGDLIARIATVSPELMRSMKSATYGGGAWIMSFNPPTVATAATPATATSPSSAAAATADANTLINLAANALRNNGFSVQVTTQPEPRLRVQAP
jgi:hypothetical protein